MSYLSSGRSNLLTSSDFANLARNIAHIFEQTQNSKVANHTKGHVELYKIHKTYASHKVELDNGSEKLIGEHRFLKAIQDMIQRFIVFKKGVAPADSLVKFVGGYIKFINEKALTSETSVIDEDEEDEEQYNQHGGKTSESRFIKTLLEYLLRGFLAKDKNVRYRILQLVTEMTSHLGIIYETHYENLRAGLIERVSDKEANVRVQAMISLMNLEKTYPEDISELEGKPSILDVLLENLSCDPSADVRCTVLNCLPINTQTLSAILDRSRDTDASVRKSVYFKLLPCEKNTEGDSSGEVPKLVDHPPHLQKLTVSERELIVRNGLGDRELSVKAAARKLVFTWIKTLIVKTKSEEIDAQNISEQSWQTIFPVFLRYFDLVGGSTIAVDALLGVLEDQPQIVQETEFNRHYWRNLTPEKVFFGRVFIEHCRDTKNQAKLEIILPNVSDIALDIQSAYNNLSEYKSSGTAKQVNEDDRRYSLEDEIRSQKAIISELLKLAVYLDYSDETGRRRTLQLMRAMLSKEELPEELVAPCLDVLPKLVSNEREFIRLVVEIIGDLRDADCDEDMEESAEVDEDQFSGSLSEKPDKSRKEMTEGLQLQSDEVGLRCLKICIEMLERVNSTFEENSTLNGIVHDLILPAMRREDSAILRENGWKSLGLCCLIAKDIAVQSFEQFLQRVLTSSGTMKTILIQSLFDITMVHRDVIFVTNFHNVTRDIFTELLHDQILSEEDPKVKALWCMGTAKLVAANVTTTMETTKVLLKALLSPLTTGNHELRQYLDYFFQAYSYSSHENKKRLSDIFIDVFLDVGEDRRNFEDVDGDLQIITSSQVAAMFVRWTDPFNVKDSVPIAANAQNKTSHGIQLDMAERIIRLLFGKGLKRNLQKEDKRALCQLLNTLHIPDVVDDYEIRSLKILMDNLIIRRPFRDNVCLNAFNRFERTISNKFKNQLEGFTESDLRELEELTELFAFLDSIIPLDDDDDDDDFDVESRQKGRKRRSNSFSNANGSRSVSPEQLNKPKIKRPRLSNLSTEEDSIFGITPSPKPRKRNIPSPSRAIVPLKSPEVIVISSDSDEESVAPEAARSLGQQCRTRVKEEPSEVDEAFINGTNSLSLNEATYDSIMDSSEEEEEEVNDLLADLD